VEEAYHSQCEYTAGLQKHIQVCIWMFSNKTHFWANDDMEFFKKKLTIVYAATRTTFACTFSRRSYIRCKSGRKFSRRHVYLSQQGGRADRIEIGRLENARTSAGTVFFK
jgi:hypothetical protein